MSPSHEETTVPAPEALSNLEREVMQLLWADAPASAEDVRQRLAPERELQGSTVRTVLRRLEQKGFATHDVDGRTYLYRPRVRQRAAAVEAVRRVIDRFCGGSTEELLLGLVDDEMITREQLERLRERVEAADPNSGGSHD